jgi:hypothetical protein
VTGRDTTSWSSWLPRWAAVYSNLQLHLALQSGVLVSPKEVKTGETHGFIRSSQTLTAGRCTNHSPLLLELRSTLPFPRELQEECILPVSDQIDFVANLSVLISYTSTFVLPLLFRNTASRERTYRVILDVCISVKPQYPGSFDHRLFPALHRTRPDTARFQPLSDFDRDRSKSKCTWTTDAARPYSRHTGHLETCQARRALADSVLQTTPPTIKAHEPHRHRNSTSYNGTRNIKVVSDISSRSPSTAMLAKHWPHL